MADQPTPRPAPPLNESEAQRINRALTEASIEAEARQADEAPAGGRFLVDGVLVDAHGEPLKGERD